MTLLTEDIRDCRDHHRKGVIDDSGYPITVLEECLA